MSEQIAISAREKSDHPAEIIYLKCGHIISIKGTSITSPQGNGLKECCLIAMAEG